MGLEKKKMREVIGEENQGSEERRGKRKKEERGKREHKPLFKRPLPQYKRPVLQLSADTRPPKVAMDMVMRTAREIATILMTVVVVVELLAWLFAKVVDEAIDALRCYCWR